jgi:hypothetical protein
MVKAEERLEITEQAFRQWKSPGWNMGTEG